MAKKIDLTGLGHFKDTENAMIATVESSSTASKAYKAGERFYLDGKLCIATADIASGGTITLNTNCKLDVLGDDVTAQSEQIAQLFEPAQLVGEEINGYYRSGVFSSYTSACAKKFNVSGISEVTLTAYSDQYRDTFDFLDASDNVLSYALGTSDASTTGIEVTLTVPNNAVYLVSSTSKVTSVALINCEYLKPIVDEEDIQEIHNTAVFKTITEDIDMSTSTAGKNVDSYGAVTTGTNYSTTQPFYAEAGTVINVTATGYRSSTAIISEYVDGVYNPLVISESNVTEYTYTTSRGMFIAICYRTQSDHSGTYTFTFSPTDVIESISKLEDPAPEYLYLFHKMAVIGDSLASGELYYSSENHYDRNKYSWLSNLARYADAECVHYSTGGMTTKLWLEDSGGCKTALLTEQVKSNIYFIALGTNDKNQEVYPIGTISDTAGTESFVGYYRSIIELVHTHAPDAYIFCMSMYDNLSSSQPYSAIVEDIAGLYSYCYFVDYVSNSEHSPKVSNDYAQNSHYTSIGYLYASKIIKKLVEDIVANNIADFKWIGLNET